MKALVFDTGSIISLTMNNLLTLLEPLKEQFKGRFIITKEVKRELVERPLKTKQFEFEALQALHYIENGTLDLVESEKIDETTKKLMDIANNIFMIKGNYLRLVHEGEISSVSACLNMGSKVIAVDERTLRLMIENPHKLKNILQHKIHSKVTVNQDNLKRFRKLTEDIKVIRSVELVTIAFELGLLDRYVPKIPNGKKLLLESVLWGVKLDGCAVSKSEIEQIMRLS